MNYYKNILPIPEFRVARTTTNATGTFGDGPETFTGAVTQVPSNRYFRVIKIANLIPDPYSSINADSNQTDRLHPFWLGPNNAIRVVIRNEEVTTTVRRINVEFQVGLNNADWKPFWKSRNAQVSSSTSRGGEFIVYDLYYEEYKVPKDNT